MSWGPFFDGVLAVFSLVFPCVLVGLVILFRLSARRGSPIRKHEKEPVAQRFAIMLGGVAMLLAWGVYAFRWMGEPPSSTAALSWRAFGAILALGSGALLIVAMQSLGMNLSDSAATRLEHHLVVSGPYAWVRHPYYLAMLGLVFGMAAVDFNLPLFVIGSGVFLLLLRRVPLEEQQLQSRFGVEYREYCVRTGRWLPRLGKNR